MNDAYRAAVEKYKEYFRKKNVDFKLVKVHYPQKDSDSESDNDDDNEIIGNQKFVKDKKNKMKSVESKEMVFSSLKLDYNKTDQAVTKSNSVYALDLNYIVENYKQPEISFNYPGGCVIPIKHKLFNSTNEKYLHVCDFNSLYPNVMILHNICSTTMCTNPKFKIKIGDNFYSPFDEKYFYQVCVPLKVNNLMTFILVFITKVEHQVSETSKILSSLNFQRKEAKKKCAQALKSNDEIEYIFQNLRQLAIKVTTNAAYGMNSALFKASFRPYSASIVTKLARLHLVRFYLHYLNYFKLLSIPLEIRDIVYGDTDSCFLICERDEINKIRDSFSKYKFHNNHLNIEIEKTASTGLFLAKKKYILMCLKNDTEKYVYSKQIFTKNKSQPTKTFLGEIISYIFNNVITCLNDINLLIGIFNKFNMAEDSNFTNSYRMSKDLIEYKSETQQVIQLRHLAKIENTSFLKGTRIESKHYNFIFSQGPYYGPIDEKNDLQQKFLNDPKNNSCTLLIDNMLKYYKEIFEKFSIKTSKNRILNSDTNAVMKNLFDCLSNFNNFKIDFQKTKQKVFNSKTSDDDLVYNNEENCLITEKCNNIIKKITK
jgi:DNA polymerase elongation subunit (family B)